MSKSTIGGKYEKCEKNPQHTKIDGGLSGSGIKHCRN